MELLVVRFTQAAVPSPTERIHNAHAKCAKCLYRGLVQRISIEDRYSAFMQRVSILVLPLLCLSHLTKFLLQIADLVAQTSS